MMFFWLMLSLAISLAWAVDVDDAEWKNFKQQYGKVYGSEEDVLRRKIYTETKEMIEAHNEKYRQGLTSYILGINHFADLVTTGDFQTGALESHYAIKNKVLLEFSEQQSLDCSVINGNSGCNGGLPELVFNYVFSYGLEEENDYPYTGFPLAVPCSYNHSRAVGVLRDYHNIETGDEASLQDAVYNVGPVTVSIKVLEDFYYFKGDFYDNPDCGNALEMLDHSVLVIGYGYSQKYKKPYWIVKNSWGDTWGDHGYVKMVRNQGNQCGIATDALYPIV